MQNLRESFFYFTRTTGDTRGLWEGRMVAVNCSGSIQKESVCAVGWAVDGRRVAVSCLDDLESPVTE